MEPNVENNNPNPLPETLPPASSSPHFIFPKLIIALVVMLFLLAIGSYFFLHSLILKTPIKQTTHQDPTAVSNMQSIKTYTDTKYGFTFDYPKNGKISEFDDGPDYKLGRIKAVVYDEVPGSSFMVEVWQNLGVTINSVTDRNTWCNKISEKLKEDGVALTCHKEEIFTMTTIAGKNAYKTSGGFGNSYATTYYIPYNSYVIGITIMKDSAKYSPTDMSDVPDQILSTFKFTSQTRDISSWKTYTDNKYGFTIKYPTDKFTICSKDKFILEGGVFDCNGAYGEKSLPYLTITVNPKQKVFNKSSYPQCFTIAEENITLDGIKGKKYSSIQSPNADFKTCNTNLVAYAEGNHEINIILEKHNSIYLFTIIGEGYGSDMDISRDQILSTFKFTQ